MNMNDALLGSLIFGKGGGGSTRTPSIIAGYSKNMYVVGTLSHTFTSSGSFQYIVFKRIGEAPVTADPVIKLNDTVLTPIRFAYQNEGQVFFYNNIVVQSGDILSVTHSETGRHSGLQLFILQDADISLFEVVGFSGNNTPPFVIPLDQWIFQVYKCGYYGNTNNCSYRLENHHSVKDDSTGANYQLSIPTPDGREYYYGFTYCIII